MGSEIAKDSVSHKCFETEASRVVIAIAICLIVMASTYFFVPVTYQVGDDAYYRAVVSGYVTGIPDGHAVFMGYAITSCIAFAERNLPLVPWYDFFSLSLLFLSFVCIVKTLIKCAYRSGYPSLWCVTIPSFVASALFVYPTAIMNFSTTALIAGSAAVVLLSEYGTTVQGQSQATLSDAILIIALLLLCHEWRLLMFEVSCCFFAVIFVFEFLKSEQSIRKSLVLICTCTALLVVACTLINHRAYSSREWSGYIQFNRARSQFMDYSHYPYSGSLGTHTVQGYSNYSELYEAFGWSEELLNLVENKFLMDPHVTINAFEALSMGPNDLAGTVKYLARFMKTRPIVQGSLVSIAILVLLSLARPQRNKKIYQFRIIYVVSLFIAVIVYCCYRGNLYFRHYVGLAFYPMLIGLIELLSMGLWRYNNSEACYGNGAHFKKYKRSTSKIHYLAFALVLVIPLITMQQAVFDETRIAIVDSRQQSYDTLLEYVSGRKDSIYIGAIYPDFSVFVDHPIDEEENYFFWGHFQSMMYSPLFYEKLNHIGFSGPFDSSVFFRENVYYVGDDPVLAEELLAYINVTYDGTYEWALVDSLPSTYVASVNGTRYVEESFDASRYASPISISERPIQILQLKDGV